MKAESVAPDSIDAYIAACDPKVRPILQKVRVTIKKAAPDATEKISYRIPTFALEGNLVHFAAFKNHIGFYPPVRGDAKLMAAVSKYANARGNLRFPIDQRVPYSLITRIVKARVRENLQKAGARKTKR